MTIATIELIKERIAGATIDSKIAVFTEKCGDKIVLDAVFESTITTKKRIQSGCPFYVGSFFSGSNMGLAVEKMKNAIKQ